MSVETASRWGEWAGTLSFRRLVVTGGYMLKCELDLRGPVPRDQWMTCEGVWKIGRTWIEPFKNVALESTLLTTGSRTVVVVRERLRGQAPLSRNIWPAGAGPMCGRAHGVSAETVDQTVAEIRRWEADYVLLEIDGTEVRFEAGSCGSAPLYLAADDDVLRASWDLDDHRDHVHPSMLDDREVVRFLTLRSRYSAKTLFRNVVRLTERGRITWRPGGPILVDYPEPGVHYRPRELRVGAPLIDAYGDLLHRAVARRDIAPEDMILELSGGTDSATVALAMRDVCSNGALQSYGLLVEGDAGDQHVNRRYALAALASLSDTAVRAAAHPPLGDEGQRDSHVNPWEEPYQDAVCAALNLVHRPVVVTGVGGDELFFLRRDERRPPPVAIGPSSAVKPTVLSAVALELADDLAFEPTVAPASTIPETALQALSVRAPMFLRAGRWPVSPLCAPELVRFGEWLPPGWREQKRLPREWLLKHGVPGEVVWPSLRENFAPVMQCGLQRYALPNLHRMLTDGSVLVDLGYIDPDKLRRVTETTEVTISQGGEIDANLYELFTLERGLRSIAA